MLRRGHRKDRSRNKERGCGGGGGFGARTVFVPLYFAKIDIRQALKIWADNLM